MENLTNYKLLLLTFFLWILIGTFFGPFFYPETYNYYLYLQFTYLSIRFAMFFLSTVIGYFRFDASMSAYNKKKSDPKIKGTIQ